MMSDNKTSGYLPPTICHHPDSYFRQRYKFMSYLHHYKPHSQSEGVNNFSTFEVIISVYFTILKSLAVVYKAECLYGDCTLKSFLK